MDVRQEFIQPFVQQVPQMANAFLPVMLDATGFRGPGCWMLGIGVPVALLAAWNVARAAGRLGDPERHPVAKTLLKYGVPGEVAEQIDAEAQNPDDCHQVHKTLFTRSWVLVPTTFGLKVRHLGEAVWSYKHTTQHYTNGVPTGKTYAAICHFKDGKTEKVPMKSERQAEDFVKALVVRVPWMFAGYDEQLNAAWKKDKPGVLAALEDRKRQLLEQAAAAEAADQGERGA